MSLIEFKFYINEKKQDLILEGQKQIISLLTLNQKIIMADFTNLTAAAEQETTVDASIIALLNDIAAQLAAANGDQAKIDAITEQIKTNSAAISAAVLANTPHA